MLARRFRWRPKIKPTPARRLIFMIIQPLDGDCLTLYTVGVDTSWVVMSRTSRQNCYRLVTPVRGSKPRVYSNNK